MSTLPDPRSGTGNTVPDLTPVPVTDTNNSAFSASAAMGVGIAYVAGRSFGVNCAVKGNVTVQLSSGNTITLPVYPGWQTFPFQVVQVVSTTATATFYNLT